MCAMRGVECIFVNCVSGDSDDDNGVISPQQALVASPQKATNKVLSHQEIAMGHKFSKVSFLETLHSKITED